MQNAIKVEIKRLSKKLFKKNDASELRDLAYQQQFEKRTGIPAGKTKGDKKEYASRHFDPKYCARNANFLAKTIWYKVLTNSYEPKPAINYKVPKPDGSKRSIMAFSIPDAALANVILRRARNRNLKRLSPSSFAYHPDKNVFDAIIALRNYETDGKLFAVQIDFEKYFDNIPYRYIKDKIDDERCVSLTPHERFVFDKFLRHQYIPFSEYNISKPSRRLNGTPQGSSVSLLLANIANHDLDTALSARSGTFVRFADDVVAICNSYEDALSLERCFIRHCDQSGLKTNKKKSPGIAIISPFNQEIKTFGYFDYLGYRFIEDGLSIPKKVVERIKYKISRLVNLYLIYYLHFGYNSARAGVHPNAYDWDLLGLIYELRRSIYGGLSEKEISNFLYEGKRLKGMKGLMGFYCLLDNPSELRALDGWVLSIVRRAMAQRRKIIASRFGFDCPTPSNRDLATGDWLDMNAWRGTDYPESRMPSLVRGWRAARKYYFTFGLENVQAPDYEGYGEISKLFDSTIFPKEY